MTYSIFFFPFSINWAEILSFFIHDAISSFILGELMQTIRRNAYNNYYQENNIIILIHQDITSNYIPNFK